MCTGYMPFLNAKIWLSKVDTPSRDHIKFLPGQQGQLYVLFFFSFQVL